MKIWEIRCGPIDKTALLLFNSDEQVLTGAFDMDGQPKNWNVAPFLKRQLKKGKRRSDASYLGPGMIVVNAKARAVLDNLLLPYGQLLEVDCEGEGEYLFNVTNLINALDEIHSEYYEGTDIIKRPAFVESRIATDPLVFKLPETVRSAIYVNATAKMEFEIAIKSSGLTGLRFVEPGSRPY